MSLVESNWDESTLNLVCSYFLFFILFFYNFIGALHPQ